MYKLDKSPLLGEDAVCDRAERPVLLEAQST